MLIGIEYSQLGRRTRFLLLVAAGAVLYFWQPDPPERLLRVGLLTILVLGAYWLSFLSEFRGRLDRSQVLVASALGLLPPGRRRVRRPPVRFGATATPTMSR